MADSDILGPYQIRRAAEQPAEVLLLQTPPQVMTRHLFQQFTLPAAEADYYPFLKGIAIRQLK